MPPKSKESAKKSGRDQPNRLASKVHALSTAGQVSKNFTVWCAKTPAVKADPSICYAKCIVLPGSTAEVYRLKQIDPPSDEQEFECKAADLLNCNEASLDPLKLRDIGLLTHQNVAAVLDFLRTRFLRNAIYTTADPLLVAINPYCDTGNSTDEWIVKYRDANSINILPPHTFTVARNAMENLHLLNKSQTIIVTGESGAGKTEATKHCMRYFASAKGGIDLRIQKAVMAANPVLEAFGNAKTLRNNNSSRFGRFMQLILGKNGGILNGKVNGFLLEKVRVCSQQPNERSYHIFYQMLKGATPEERNRYHLLNMKDYANLNAVSGGCYDAPGINDIDEWNDVRQSLLSMQLPPDEIDEILSIVSGVLLLGNINFIGVSIDGQDNAAELNAHNLEVLRTACVLLRLDDVSSLATNLCMSLKQIGRETVTVRIKKTEAETLCQSLSKAMYDYLFKWIINRLNTTIQPVAFETFMGMLDIFGFEIFEHNSLEQILINITNEFLQKNFTDIVFERESKLYREEGISTTELVFTDNKAVIDTLIGKRNSVFACLEDACVNKGGSDNSFYSQMCQSLNTSPCFIKPQGGDRSLVFTIAHTIADINYSAHGFLSKNMDLLKPEFIELAQQSSSAVVREMFTGIVVERGKLAKGQLIGSQFLRQLDEMIGIILTTEPHFIRCVKPNETKKPLDWDQGKVLNQLFSLSILEALQLKKLGFSWRRTFAEFVATFRYLRLDLEARMKLSKDVKHQRTIAEELIAHCGKFVSPFTDGKQWQIGKTMVFLKPEVTHQLLLLQRNALEEYRPCVVMVESLWTAKCLRRSALKQAELGTRIQSRMRAHLARRGFQPETKLKTDAKLPCILA